MRWPTRPMSARHNRAAADTWSSSKPSNAGASPAHRRTPPQRPGPPRHDPAWLAFNAPRRSCACGDDAARAGDTAYRSGGHLKPRSWPISTLQAAHEGHVPTRRCASSQPVRPPHNEPEAEKPIGHRPGPAASCFGGYRTPRGARYPSQIRTIPRPRPKGGFRREQPFASLQAARLRGAPITFVVRRASCCQPSRRGTTPYAPYGSRRKTKRVKPDAGKRD